MLFKNAIFKANDPDNHTVFYLEDMKLWAVCKDGICIGNYTALCKAFQKVHCDIHYGPNGPLYDDVLAATWTVE